MIFDPNEIGYCYSLMVLQTLFENLIFLLVNFVFEMLPTQNVLLYLSQRNLTLAASGI